MYSLWFSLLVAYIFDLTAAFSLCCLFYFLWRLTASQWSMYHLIAFKPEWTSKLIPQWSQSKYTRHAFQAPSCTACTNTNMIYSEVLHKLEWKKQRKWLICVLILFSCPSNIQLVSNLNWSVAKSVRQSQAAVNMNYPYVLQSVSGCLLAMQSSPRCRKIKWFGSGAVWSTIGQPRLQE